jgi:PAS domain S-box-containing protein
MREMPTYEALEKRVRALEEAESEHKKSMAALQASEKKYKDLFEKAPIGIFRTTSQGQPLIVNSAMASILGLPSPEEAIRHYRQLAQQLYVHSEKRDDVIRLLRDKGHVENFEYEARTVDGRIVWLSMNAQVVERNPDGSFIIEGFATDITQRKQAEAALKESEAHLRTLIRAIPDLVWLKDEQGIYLSCNSKFERFFGSKEKDILGKSDYDFMDKKLADFFRSNDQAAIATGGPKINEEEVDYADDGHHEILETIKTPMFSSDGRLIGVLGIGRDITARKQAESERLDHLKFFECMDKVNRVMQGTNDLDQMLGDVLDIALSVFDCDRVFLHYPCDPEAVTWSVAMERTRSEYPGVHALGRPIPMDADIAWVCKRVLDAQGPVQFGPETDIPLGEAVWKRFRVRSMMCITLYPKAGGPWLLGLHQCSHARKWNRSEEKLFQEIARRLSDGLTTLLMYRDLEKSEEFLNNIVENIPDMIFVKDARDLRFVRFNRAGETLLGYSRGEMLGKNEYDLFPKKEADLLAARDHEILGAKELVDIPDESIRNRSGEERILHTKKIPILDESGEPRYLLGISEDITERKRAEQERDMLIAAIEQVGEMISITDHNGLIQYVNPAFESTTGYRRAEVIGRTPQLLDSDNPDEAFFQRSWETVSSGRTWSERVIHKRKDGTLFTVEASVSPIRDASGRITNYVSVRRNISDQLRLEAQFRQAQKMESVGRLAGGVAHDFNNMLGVILGHAELATHHAEANNPLRAHLEAILDAGHRSADITRQLLAFARRQTISPKVLDLNATVEGMFKMIRRLIGEQIDLAWLPKANVWPVKMDPSQIDQILVNLCVNARDAISEMGKITIETGKVTLGETCCSRHNDFVPGDYVLIAVSDNGCGMDRETCDRIFEPFFTTKDVSRGSGLGLSTVYGIVKQNNGLINVYSEPGKGTTFRIYLPRHAGDVNETEAQTVKIPHGRGETVLLVEDEAVMMEVSQAILENLGYRVLTAMSPTMAIQLAEQHASEIDLLITDVIMPELNGRDLAAMVRDRCPAVKTLFMSGYTADVIVHQGVLEAGVNFIQKPFSIQDLASKIRISLDDGDA